MIFLFVIIAFAAGFLSCAALVAGFAAVVWVDIARERRMGSRGVDRELEDMCRDDGR